MGRNFAELTNRELDIRISYADYRASHWLAEGNAASERGNKARAEKCYAKSQYWHDRYNALTGRGA